MIRTINNLESNTAADIVKTAQQRNEEAEAEMAATTDDNPVE